jgi:hypothetical protein
VGRRLAAPLLAIVHHVVVQQRTQMQHLARAHQPRDGAVVADGPGAQRGEQRPQALAAGPDEVAGDVGDGGHRRRDEARQRGLCGGEVVCDQRRTLGDRRQHRPRRASLKAGRGGAEGQGGHGDGSRG